MQHTRTQHRPKIAPHVRAVVGTLRRRRVFHGRHERARGGSSS